MELQRSILLFFSQNATSFFDFLAQFFTQFGEGVISIVICLFIIFFVNKKKGFTIVFSFFAANGFMDLLKVIIRFPRPWVVYPEIECKRFETATGYSFPSGHTTCAASIYGSVSVIFRKRLIAILSAIVIALVGISRCYLCCHWPLDVAGGLMIGLFFAFFVTPAVYKLIDNRKFIFKWFPIIGAVIAAAGLVTGLLIDCAGLDYRLHKDLAMAFGLLGFGMISFVLEEKYFCFKLSESLLKRAITFAMAVAGAAFFALVMGKIVGKTGVWDWVKYSLAVIWACLCVPAIGLKLNLFDKED